MTCRTVLAAILGLLSAVAAAEPPGEGFGRMPSPSRVGVAAK